MPCTFYILPSRAESGRCFAGFLETLFPGLDWKSGDAGELAEMLADLAETKANVFVIYREDLPEEEDFAEHLAEVYGAEDGDEVIELSGTQENFPGTPQVWTISTVEADPPMSLPEAA